MAWIKTIPFSEADGALKRALEAQHALYHAFATFGVLMSPELPLTRAQHEMITTRVSALNRCHY